MLASAKRTLGNVRDLLAGYLPVKVGSIGDGSYIPFPHRIQGAKRIRIGSRLRIGRNAYLHAIESYEGQAYHPDLIIGDDVYIGPDCYIVAVDRIEIQDGCVLSEGVYISDVAHGMDPDQGLIMKQALKSKGPVVIGKGTFVGLRAAIMPGVELGPHCIVGTAAVVTHSFPAYSVIGGNPGRCIKRVGPTTDDVGIQGKS
jgi:acetyltransferase-like isoleucine patch superfamily enzyme